MTCYHGSFTIRKKKLKEVILFVGNTPMLANWVQIEMGKIFKTIKVHHNNLLFFLIINFLFMYN
jgi:hypothetical protein